MPELELTAFDSVVFLQSATFACGKNDIRKEKEKAKRTQLPSPLNMPLS